MTSCWALLKRWISSTKRMVRSPCMARRSLAASATRRRSATPAVTAETGSKWERVRPAMRLARVVLPEPGGPQSSSEGIWSASMARRRTRPGPTTWPWPTNSSKERGRMRAARGASRSMRSREAWSKSVMGVGAPVWGGGWHGGALTGFFAIGKRLEVVVLCLLQATRRAPCDLVAADTEPLKVIQIAKLEWNPAG